MGTSSTEDFFTGLGLNRIQRGTEFDQKDYLLARTLVRNACDRLNLKFDDEVWIDEAVFISAAAINRYHAGYVEPLVDIRSDSMAGLDDSLDGIALLSMIVAAESRAVAIAEDPTRLLSSPALELGSLQVGSLVNIAEQATIEVRKLLLSLGDFYGGQYRFDRLNRIVSKVAATREEYSSNNL